MGVDDNFNYSQHPFLSSMIHASKGGRENTNSAPGAAPPWILIITWLLSVIELGLPEVGNLVKLNLAIGGWSWGWSSDVLDPKFIYSFLAVVLYWEFWHLHCCGISPSGLAVLWLTDGPRGLFRRDHRPDGICCCFLDLLVDCLWVPKALNCKAEPKTLDRVCSLKAVESKWSKRTGGEKLFILFVTRYWLISQRQTDCSLNFFFF